MALESFQSGPSGGKGGNPFTDDIPADGIKVQSVDIRHGDWIDAVRLNYSDGSSTDLHGGNGGTKTNVPFEQDEFLTEISGTYGSYINSITLRTNVQTYGPYGKVGGGDDKEYRYQVPEETMEVIGFFGACGSYLDAFGIIGRQRLAAALPASAAIRTAKMTTEAA